MLFLLEQTKPLFEEYGYPVLNLQAEMDTIGIDVTQDFVDEHHMNIFGQIKMTDYIGNMVMNDFRLSPRNQSEQNRSKWEVCVSNTEEYIKMAIDFIHTGRNTALYETARDWFLR